MPVSLMPEQSGYSLLNHATPTVNDRPLAIVVEQVVRSLPVSQARKARVRDDLFSHLKSIFEEESANGGTGEEIVARSLARFGDPGEISNELRGSTTWSQTLAWRMGQVFDFRVSESAEQFCFRFFLYIASLLVAVWLMIWSIRWALHSGFQPQEASASFAALPLISLLITALLYFGIKFADTVLHQRPRQRLLFFSLAAPIRLRIVVDASPGFFMAIWLSSLVLAYPAMYFTSSYLFADWHSLIHPDWGFLTLTAMGTTLVGLIAGFGFTLDRRYRQLWESLPLSGPNSSKESIA